MCCTRLPHVPVATIFEISRYMYIRNALLIRFLSVGFFSSVTGCAAYTPPHVSVGTIFEMSRYIFIKETTHMVAENSSTAHDRFRPS
ncbi:hypothetical protein CSKR_106946 [Clonorchis sinensis]|uniref:Uncharacterized protein n=1 Tax=Clonorchis sinensis TaxID=79923 RepID=A0A3R7CHY5_CLOSI|nr:hypothetical protein CSKR_106946 [Clonorchis sinensis]